MNNLFDGLTDSLYLPEEVLQARDRIRAATQFFTINFDIDGNPISKLGESLARKYENVKLHNLDELRAKARWSTIPVLILKEGRIIFDDGEILNNVLSEGDR